MRNELSSLLGWFRRSVELENVMKRGGGALWDYVLFIVLSIDWGLAFVAIRRADYELSPVSFALLRWLIASAGLLAIAPFLGRPRTKFQTKDLPRLLLLSFDMVPVYNLSISSAEGIVSAGLAGLFNAISPVFIALLSAVFLKDRVGNRLLVALPIAVCGAAIITLPDLGSASPWGPLAAAGAAISLAVFYVVSKPLVDRYGAAPLMIWAGVIGTLMLFPLFSVSDFGAQVANLSPAGWVSILYLSIIVTVAGYTLFYTLLAQSKATKLAVQLYLIPIISVLGGALFLGESVNAGTVAGGGLMLISIALARSER